MLFCEADTKNMVLLIKEPFPCMYFGYFGEKTRKEYGQYGKRHVYVFRGKQARDPTLINGSTRLCYFSTNDAQNQKQI